MKPLLVLIAAALAAAGLFFVMQGDGKEPNTGGNLVTRTDDTGVTTSNQPGEGETKLEDVAAIDTRKLEDTKVAATNVEATLPVVNGTAGFGELMGKVVDEGGSPVLGAVVTLTRYGSQSFFFEDVDRSTDVTAETASDGTFRFERVPVYESYALLARHADYSDTEIPSVIVQEGQVTDTPDIVVVPGRSLRGVVKDTGGNAVPNAQLTLSANAILSTMGAGVEAESNTILSDENGNYEFKNLSPGQNYVVEAMAEGYGSVPTPPLAILEGEDTVHDIVLEVASMMAGTVTSADGEVVVGATVQAYLIAKNSPGSVNTSVKTDEAGSFELTDIPPGEFQMVVRHPLYRPDARTRAQSGDMNITIALAPLPKVSGQVLDAASGSPITSFEVQLRRKIEGAQDNMSSADSSSRRRIEHPEGRFELFVSSNGQYMVEAIAPGYADTSSEPFVSSLGTDSTGIMVRMTKGGTLVGRVVSSSGLPVAGATVETHDKEWSDDLFWQSLGDAAPGSATETTVRTGKDGTFKLDFLTPAKYQIVVRHKDHAMTTVKDLFLSEGQELRVPDVKLPLGAQLSGAVIGPSGLPMAGATVKMFPTTQGAGTYTAQTNKAGEYRIKNIREGSYKLHATRPRSNTSNAFLETKDMKDTQRTLTIQDGDILEGQDFKLTDR